MKVQINGAGPTILAESENVDEIELKSGSSYGAVYFSGRKGEDWIDLAWWDLYDCTAGLGTGPAVHEVVSVFVAPVVDDNFKAGVRSAATFLEANVNKGDLLARQVLAAHFTQREMNG